MEIIHGIIEKVPRGVDEIYFNLDLKLSFDLNEDFYDPINTPPKVSEKIGNKIFQS